MTLPLAEAATLARKCWRTLELAAPAWTAIDADDAARLRRIVRPWSTTITQTSFGFG